MVYIILLVNNIHVSIFCCFPRDEIFYQRKYRELQYIYYYCSVNGVWLTADQFKCGESKACSGCCYSYPATSSKVHPKHGDLQLSCSESVI